MPKLNKSDLLAYNIGLITLKYNDVQFWFFAVFQSLMHDALYLAHPTFFSVKSDRAQRDMVRYLAEERLKEYPDLLKTLGKLIERANQLGGRRNDALHAMWRYDIAGKTPEVSYPLHNRLKGKNIEHETKALFADLNDLELALYPFYEEMAKTLRERSRTDTRQLVYGAFARGLRPPDRAQAGKAKSQRNGRKGN